MVPTWRIKRMMLTKERNECAQVLLQLYSRTDKKVRSSDLRYLFNENSSKARVSVNASLLLIGKEVSNSNNQLTELQLILKRLNHKIDKTETRQGKGGRSQRQNRLDLRIVNQEIRQCRHGTTPRKHRYNETVNWRRRILSPFRMML